MKKIFAIILMCLMAYTSQAQLVYHFIGSIDYDLFNTNNYIVDDVIPGTLPNADDEMVVDAAIGSGVSTAGVVSLNGWMIFGGTFLGTVVTTADGSTIADGIFSNTVTITRLTTITGGEFRGAVTISPETDEGTDTMEVSGGIYYAPVTISMTGPGLRPFISAGTFRSTLKIFDSGLLGGGATLTQCKSIKNFDNTEFRQQSDWPSSGGGGGINGSSILGMP